MNIRKVIFLLLAPFIVLSCNKKKEGNTMNNGYIKIAVDQTMAPTIQAAINLFESENEAIVEPLYTSERETLDLLMADSVRLAVTARRLTTAERNYFYEQKYQPEEIRIALDAIALIVHPSNPDSIINVQNVKRILTGEAKQWNEIYPGSGLGNIQVIFDNTNSSIVRYANDSICRDKPLSSDLNALNLNEEVVEYVSQNPGSLGLIGVNLISDPNDSTVVELTTKVKVMRVTWNEHPDRFNAVQPYQYYIYTGQYPFIREIYVILNDPRGELPKGFTRFLISDRGQRIILRSGLLPSVMPVNAVKIRD